MCDFLSDPLSTPILHVCEQRRLWRDWAWAGHLLCDKYHNLMNWLKFKVLERNIRLRKFITNLNGFYPTSRLCFGVNKTKHISSRRTIACTSQLVVLKYSVTICKLLRIDRLHKRLILNPLHCAHIYCPLPVLSHDGKPSKIQNDGPSVLYWRRTNHLITGNVWIIRLMLKRRVSGLFCL